VWNKMAPSERDQLMKAYNSEHRSEDVSCERLCEAAPAYHGD